MRVERGAVEQAAEGAAADDARDRRRDDRPRRQQVGLVARARRDRSGARRPASARSGLRASPWRGRRTDRSRRALARRSPTASRRRATPRRGPPPRWRGTGGHLAPWRGESTRPISGSRRARCATGRSTSGSSIHSASVVPARAHSMALIRCSVIGASEYVRVQPARDGVEPGEPAGDRPGDRQHEGQHDGRRRGEQRRAERHASDHPRRRARRRAGRAGRPAAPTCSRSPARRTAVPDGRDDDAQRQRDERQHDAGEQLGGEHARAPGHEGEGDHRGPLRPLRGRRAGSRRSAAGCSPAPPRSTA